MTPGQNSMLNYESSTYLQPVESRLKKVSKFNSVIKMQQLRRVTIQRKIHWILTPGRYWIGGVKMLSYTGNKCVTKSNYRGLFEVQSPEKHRIWEKTGINKQSIVTAPVVRIICYTYLPFYVAQWCLLEGWTHCRYWVSSRLVSLQVLTLHRNWKLAYINGSANMNCYSSNCIKKWFLK